LDRAVSGLVRPYLAPDLASIFSDARFRPHYADGRYFVKQAQGPYDLVIVNVPDPQSAMINRFYTLEFCREVADILAPDGVLVTRAGETHGYLGEEVGRYAGSVYRTLKEVFPEVVVTPVGATYFFAARRPGLVSDDPEVLAQRYRASGVQSEYFAPELYAQFFPSEWVEFIKDALSRYRDVPINTDQKPVTYFYGLVLWDRYSGSHLTPALTWLRGLNPIAPLALLVAGAVLVALYQLFGRGNLARMLRFNLTWTVATTGCAAMAIELVLVFAFQNTFGYVYEKVGLIIGVFMFGLAVGGLSATGLVARRPRLGLGAMLAVNAALMLFAGSLPGALGLLSGGTYHAQEVGFGVLVWMGGLLTGAHFPLAAHLLQLTGAGVARAAGRLDWADHRHQSFAAQRLSVAAAPGLRASLRLFAEDAGGLRQGLFLGPNAGDAAAALRTGALAGDRVLADVVAEALDEQFLAVRTVGVSFLVAGDVAQVDEVEPFPLGHGRAPLRGPQRRGWEVAQLVHGREPAEVNGHVGVEVGGDPAGHPLDLFRRIVEGGDDKDDDLEEHALFFERLQGGEHGRQRPPADFPVELLGEG
ncbi:MAG: hypothetical protein KAX80_10310, partial [Planctomycetes bacterium]|nr:hypothetical protein [Planctomycetota bacterium]